MPELPEVEIAARQLRSWLSGRRIEGAQAARTRVIRGQAPARFGRLAGQRLSGIERLGKWMLLSFDGGAGLLSHLGMTGKWVKRRDTDTPAPHARATLQLDGGLAVDYRDPRLFGRLICGEPSALRALPALRELGPDPLHGIDVDRLRALFARTRRSIKQVLMDQRTLAGLGNIQVSEALHRARVGPQRPAASLPAAEVGELAHAIGESLRATLRAYDGDEPITYVEEGGANVFLVYDRAGKPCFTCGSAVRRIVQGGRSTFFCPVCQPRRRTGRRVKSGPRAARRS